MLIELENLSKNINRLVEINDRNQQARLAVEQQLKVARAQRDTLWAQLEQAQRERDTLCAKIDDAQVRLNAILEKLPNTRLADSLLEVKPSQAGDALLTAFSNDPQGETA
ncbi:ATPase [Candidatus Vallotia cooleyia]|uniref:ATPase n=1 Tax=Candidatus Vallotiella adelgis TaxID=1177211 RepID=UPI001D027A35|nr:ATPase [Candidatus Vallotia cooleyia]UDG82109.1 hypothetical protein GJV44_00352 [Candidatus Vallotia cooleyia]